MNRKENCIKLPDKILSEIRFEIGQIDNLFIVYQGLFDRALQLERPDYVEVTALASVVHSFYTGLEKIFVSIAKRLDNGLPTGPHWHRDLLLQLGQSTPYRIQVLTTETVARLNNYLSFRHIYRHSYSFFLDWEELESLVRPMRPFWETVKAELHSFMASLEKA